MKKKRMVAAMALFCGCAALFACSDNNEAESEPPKGVIEQMTDEAAQEAINHIRTPLDKARSAADREQDRLNDMDESINDRQ